MPIIRNVHIEDVDIPLLHGFATSRDKSPRRISTVIRVALQTDEGLCGFGECVPVPYVTGETRRTIVQTLARCVPMLLGRDCLRRADIARSLAGYREKNPSAMAALDMAVYDVVARATGMSLWELFGGAMEEVWTDVTLPLTSDGVLNAAEFAGQGFRVFKVKVGRSDRGADLEVLRHVHAEVPGAMFRLDANQAFEADDALQFLDTILGMGLQIELLEQPVSRDDLDGLDRVARESPVPVFADEAVLTARDALAVVERTAVQGVNVKLLKAGVQGALDIASIVRAAGRRLMVGCMLETTRGIEFALSLAAGSGLFDYFDLDSHMLLNHPQVWTEFVQSGPAFRVSRR